jgi:hypothetical protein
MFRDLEWTASDRELMVSQQEVILSQLPGDSF